MDGQTLYTDPIYPPRDRFTAWVNDVDKQLLRKTGMISADLIDVPYHDMFDDGYTPTQAAAQAIRVNKDEMGF